MQDALQAVHGHEGHVGALEQRHPLGGRALQKDVGQHAVDMVDVARAGRVTGEPRVFLRQGCAPGFAQEVLPLLVGIDERADVAVLRAIRVPLGRELARVATTVQRRFEREPAQVIAQHEGRHGFEHRHVHALAPTRALARHEAGEDGVHASEPDNAVGHRGRHVAGHAARSLGNQVRQGRRPLNQIVVGRARGIRAILAEAEQPGIDDARIERRDLVVTQSEPRHGLGPHVVQQHVGAPQHALERMQTRGVLEVEHDAALVAVGVQVDRAHALMPRRADLPHEVAARRLHLDDIRAHIPERL